jgi:hypothetical protein
MNMTLYIKKIKRNLDDYGTSQTAKKIILFLLKNIYVKRSYYIYRFDLRLDFCPKLPPAGILFKIINKNDVQIIKQIEDMEEWLYGRVPSCIEHGLCIVALDDNKVAGFNLINFNETFIPLINITKRLKANQAWSEQITIKKDYRKQGLAMSLRHYVFMELRKRGICKLYGGTLITNIPSIKLAQTLGFLFITKVQYLKIFNREFHTYRRIKHEYC